MKRWILLLCCLLISIAPCAQEITSIRVPPPRSADDTVYLYSTGLLRKALVKAANGRQIPKIVPAAISMTTERRLHELRLKRSLDLFWLGASEERARNLLVIPIPVERGLMGYRQFIIRKDKRADFDAVKTVADLAPLRACLDEHWIDTDIFRDANLSVVTSVNRETLFKQLAAGRCDYFPRGFHEARIEIIKRAADYPTLEIYESLILHYPMAAYFFVHKDNTALAEWIKDGLEKMIDDGELMAYIEQHEFTRHTFPLMPAAQRRMLIIPNAYLPSFSNEKDSRYWFQTNDFVPASD